MSRITSILPAFALLMLLTLGSGNAWADNTWWRLRVKAIHRDGTPAASYVAVYGNGGTAPTLTTNDFTMPTPSNGYNTYQKKAAVALAKQARNGEVFQGWYLEEECETLIVNAVASVWYAPNANVPLYATSEDAAPDEKLVTIYALFSDPVDWGAGDTPPSAGEYYIFNIGRGTFVGPGVYQYGSYELKFTPDANNALLFTITDGSDGKKKLCATDGTTYCLKANGSLGTDFTQEHTITAINDNTCCKVQLSDGYYWLMNTQGKCNRDLADDAATNAEKQWVFISKQAFLNNCKVKSKNSDGSALIDSPTGDGTAYVSFNVSELGNVSDFEYSLSNTTHWEIVDTTRNGNVITLGVKYSAQGVGDFSTTIVTMSSKAKSPATVTSATATASAAVSFTPVCEMAVGSKLDWSYEGEELKETFNIGMEVAASQRTRLKNQLVYNGDNAIVRDVATWTATITGTNANQFKFSNGEQEISGTYSPELLDVIYAPTAAGTHTATLRVVVSYTTATSEPVEVTLSGKAQNVSAVTMAVNGATASNNASLNLGDIIGTNSQDVTVDLYIQGMSNLTKEWSAPAGTFEFDENSLDLSKANQTLTFRAHRSTAVTEATNHTGTLTIKSSGTTVGTLTLTYTAKPLLTPTVTWNWTLLNEDATYSNPLTIVSGDGAWTLEQKDGNGGMTYDAENKTITTEYMHHESGYTATFELNIAQTATYAALTDTLYATISANIPPVIEIKNATDYATYVEGNSWVSYKADINAVNIGSDKAYFKWSGQSYFTFDFAMVSGTGSHSPSIYEMYSDDTEKLISNQALNHGSSYGFPVSPHAIKVKIQGSNNYKNIRYFEYDTIDVDYHGVVFVKNGATMRDITATFANKRAVTVSLNAAAQPYFELRAEGKPTGSTLVYDGTDGLAVHQFVKDKVFTVAFKEGKTWAEANVAADNGFQVILQDNYTYNSEVVVLPIALEEEYTVTYKHDAHGSYKVTYHDDMENPHTVSTSADYGHTVSSIVETSCTATLSEPTPTPESGYMFRGWKLNGELVSCKATYTVIPASGATVEPVFVEIEEAVYTIDDAAFADLDVALSTAGSIADTKPVVVLQKDVTLSEPATHTIPAGVTLLIPYKANFSELQLFPEIVTTATPLAAYRTLTLKEGVNFVVNGNICVSAKIMAAGGGNKSAYPTDECGVINMANGGHIELNNGAHLYCWGYIKGQDMDQGNNTVGTGTITVNAGAVVHENFELGDWRGGTASSDIYTYRESKMLFPFQSYALQNVEIPTTYTYGSKLETFMVVNTGFGSVPFSVSMIGSSETLFLLKDAGSTIRKWYDPTTDLCCYELSGTAQLDELVMNLPFVGDFASGSCNLPVSNSMHIILKDNLTLSKPLTVQAGAVVEIKPTATIDLTTKVHLFDKDEWGLYIHKYYFRSFNNLTSHKDRGAENSKDGLEDAKFIIDGTLNVKSGQGYIYSTAGGANLMGNGGGKIVFEGNLPGASQLWQVTVLGQKPYIEWKSTAEAAANLCNEDGSYTKSYAGETFHNIHGRWFSEKENEHKPQADHTYMFRYLNNGNAGDEVGTAAVYSHDKTGLEARMKWFNVEADDDCDDWWTDAAGRFYNYTILGEWHQFIATDQANVYSGSNNVLYLKDGCTWTENAYIDENCLYTFADVKKALVNGEFIPLTANGYDPAYHATADASQYYICFSGCNWHPATPYAGESKAYTIEPETGVYLHYIWFENDWLNVERDGAFFFTADEVTNVRTYYEYVNGDWMVATPYVSVTDEAETRNFYMIKEAFNVAQIKKGATIKLLRDLTNVSERLSYSTQNTTCTLDLNGHLLAGAIDSLIYVNAPSATFIITDNSDLKNGKIRTTKARAIFVKAGIVEVNNGTIEASPATVAAYAIYGVASTTIRVNDGYLAAIGAPGSKCLYVGGSCSISGGHFTDNTNLENYCAANKYPFETADPKYKYEVSTGYTITFKNDAATLQTLHLKPGETPAYTAAQPTKDGYKFIGWSPAIAAATADATYTAQFETKAAEERCVTLNSNGGNEGLQYVYVTSGSTIGTLPAGTTKDGHTFAGWFTDATNGTQITTATTVSADVTWYAHYNKNSYTLTWDANGGNLDGGTPSGSVEFGAAITAPTATKEGHTFISWNATPATTMPAQNVTYTAQWSVSAKHYLQNIDGTYPAAPAATDNVTGGVGEYVTPATKTYDGFITPATQTVKIGVEDEVRYEYVRRSYTITLDANGGTCATTSLTVKHGATLTLPVATKNGANCTGWFTKAIGGDQITNETAILYNIGTLYAQYADLNVTAPLTVSDERTVTDVRVTTTGALNVTGSINATNFYLESNGSTASGQLTGAGTLNISGNAYFDLKVNAKNHQWYAVAVPWQVDAQTGISVNGRTLTLGSDFDIIYYDGARRAAEGKQKCWKYVEDDGDKTLVPGRLYMIGLMQDAATIRFAKKSDAGLLTTTTSVAAHASTTGDDYDANWNGVANPALFHAYVNAGTTAGQVYNPDTKSYSAILMNEAKMVVGQGAFVQAPANKNIEVSVGGAYAAQRRAKAQEAPLYDVRIAAAEADYTDRLFVTVDDEKSEDKYIIGKDLAKVGVSKLVAQMWIARYNTELCMNTMAPVNGTADYPLTLFAPKAGEYVISSPQVVSGQYELYLTLDGNAIWNLTNGAYTLTLPQGNTTGYGLRISSKAPQVTTGVDEIIVDANGETRKVLINDQVFIIRGNELYTIDGRLVK